ncbi:PRC-barrel domain-containing protein [Actinoplanes sp. LDG1-06]|uniref:PRC-barrel domain-containing protein n=1 Tax=Paractinoplanes ovalisporus TaxID=2810368 RepID=A0ABS2AQ81_9ACTN|nr:PRC-barrel domain-containing protein [Actinoplanes ovalisporus]MBM2622022.1 PRC-barrel domain-containing protein [Actinoplanes ovalisporus]
MTTLQPLKETDQIVADPAQDIRGRRVVDSDGSEVGTVADLLVDAEESRVRFLNVAHGGILGFGATSSFIPIDAVREVTDDEVRIDTSKDRVSGAPRFDPELAERDYLEEVYGYYGHTPFWSPGYFYPGFPR